MLLFYVRHGDPIYDPDSLTPLGHRQAEAVARRLARYGIDRIFASTSNRAILTATPTSEICKKPITQLDFANEGVAWGFYTVLLDENRRTWLFQHAPSRQAMVSDEVYRLGDRWYEHPAFAESRAAEGVPYYNEHIDQWMQSLGYEHDRESKTYRVVTPNTQRVALFAHEGFGKAFISSLLDIPYPLIAARFEMSHSDLTVVEFPEEQAGETVIPRVLTYSNDAHLYGEHLPTRYQNVIPL